MTVLYGHVSLSGGPVAAESATVLEAGYPFANGRVFRRQAFPEGVMGSLASSTAHGDGCDEVPLESPCLVVAASVRLDNRDELLRALRPAQGATCSDTYLLTAAYEYWGTGCFDRLLGDWCCAIWDKREQKLILARDATGISGMMWWSDGHQVIFSTALTCVTAHWHVPKTPDPLVAACFLTAFDDPEIEDRTFYTGVYCISPGSFVVFSSRRIDRHRWWVPDRLPMLQVRSVEECDEAFMALYQDAVRSRLRRASGEGVGILLSAGLDSGSVLALAAPLLASEGARAHALVHRPAGGGGRYGQYIIDDEFDAASEVARFIGNTDVTSRISDGQSWLSAIADSVATFGEPTVSSAGFYWLSDIAGCAAQSGTRVLLTGQGGNGTVSWTGTGSFWENWRGSGLRSAANQIASSRFSLGKALRVQALSPIKQWVRRRFMRSGLYLMPALNLRSVVHPDLAREVGLDERFRRLSHDILDEPPYSAAQIRIWRLHVTLGNSSGTRWMNLGDRFGLVVRDPTRDQRLVEFCWRLPDRFFWGAGEQRMLLRRNLRGLLPPDLLARPIRGLQASDIDLLAMREAGAIKNRLQRLESSALFPRWVDVGLLQRLLEIAKNTDSVTRYRILFTNIAPSLALANVVEHQ